MLSGLLQLDDLLMQIVVLFDDALVFFLQRLVLSRVTQREPYVVGVVRGL